MITSDIGVDTQIVPLRQHPSHFLSLLTNALLLWQLKLYYGGIQNIEFSGWKA